MMKRSINKISIILILLLLTGMLSSCKSEDKLSDNYRTYYEVFLYSFCDSDGDGIGDINGLISKLDYLNDGDDSTDEDLSVTGIWLMPVSEATSYHKYDVTDYYKVDEMYGTNDDFKKLSEECHKRNIKLIIDMVVNHSSVEHPWFTSARKSITIEPCGNEVCSEKDLCREHNPYCKYYNFTQDAHGKGGYYKIKDDWYYEGVFWSGMPDLNLDSEELRSELKSIFNFWLELGADGFRVDAAKHFYDGKTSKNIEFLNFMSECVKAENKDNYLVAEVWSDISEIADYYESSFDSFFNFSYAKEDGLIAKMLNSKNSTYTGDYYSNKLADNQKLFLSKNNMAIEAPFTGNHDTGRIAGILMSKPERIKMQAAMLMTMSGNVFIYYGDELGMKGSGKDENKRAPMLWSDTESEGMTFGPPAMEDVKQKFPPVDIQENDETSILNFYKKAIKLRNEYPEISHGIIESLHISDNEDISAIRKTYNGKTVTLVYNLSETDTIKLELASTNLKDADIEDSLSVFDEEIILENNILEVPPYSVTVLR